VLSEFDGEVWMRGFLREPGQGWGEPIDMLPPETRLTAASSAVAASERGDALVAASSIDSTGRMNVRVARRQPGGVFGPPERLAVRRTTDEAGSDIRAGFGASGEAIVTWTVEPSSGEAASPSLWVAIAPPGAPFGAPQRIAPYDEGSRHALAVGADGRALAVFTSGERLVAAEREPGGAFGAPYTLARTADRPGAAPAAVLRPGGGAVVAWTSPLTAGLSMRTRERAGAFGPAIALVGPKRLEPDALMVQQRFGGTAWSETDAVRVLATGDGRVMIAWGHLSRRQGIWRIVPGVALADFTGTERETHALGGGLRNIDGVTPVLLADGSRAVAWTDNDQRGNGGRMHLAREGTPDAAGAAAPKVTFTPPRSRALEDEEPLTLRVTCDAACDVEATLAERPAVTASASLPAAGSRRLSLAPVEGPIAPRGGGPVRILLRSSAPGAHGATAGTLRLNLRRVAPKFPPRVLGLTVTRDGDDLLVRWRTAQPARPRSYVAYALDDDGAPVGAGDPKGTSRRTRFALRIRDARDAETVTVFAVAENVDKTRRTTVKVPR
jgi:hypothetical protein